MYAHFAMLEKVSLMRSSSLAENRRLMLSYAGRGVAALLPITVFLRKAKPGTKIMTGDGDLGEGLTRNQTRDWDP